MTKTAGKTAPIVYVKTTDTK